MTTTYTTREAWLVAAIEALGAGVFKSNGVELPPVRVSVGWPGGRGPKGKVIGQCWKRAVSSDGVNQLFVSPVLGDSARVIDVLTHELVHAVDDCANGHKGAFLELARKVGLEGKATATVAGEALQAELDLIVEQLGEYPHAVLGGTPDDSAEGPKKQGTRMLKLVCASDPVDGYTVRTTQKWLDLGMPSCPCCAEPMVLAEAKA